MLGSAFSGNVGRDLGHLVVYLAPWMVASVAFSVTFPILFVLERSRVLIPLAIGSIVVYVPIALALRALLGLPGLALSLGITVLGMIFVLMAAVSRRMLALAARGLAQTAAVIGAFVLVAFGLPSLVLPSILAAARRRRALPRRARAATAARARRGVALRARTASLRLSG